MGVIHFSAQNVLNYPILLKTAGILLECLLFSVINVDNKMIMSHSCFILSSIGFVIIDIMLVICYICSCEIFDSFCCLILVVRLSIYYGGM